jgi:hypothetical protein
MCVAGSKLLPKKKPSTLPSYNNPNAKNIAEGDESISSEGEGTRNAFD